MSTYYSATRIPPFAEMFCQSYAVSLLVSLSVSLSVCLSLHTETDQNRLRVRSALYCGTISIAAGILFERSQC